MKNKIEDTPKPEQTENVTKCRVRIYKLSNMQRCPYIHEMKERLLGEQIPMEIIPTSKIPTPPPFQMDQEPLLKRQLVPTVVKLNPDGYGSHTTPTHHEVVDRTPLIAKESEGDFHYVHQKVYPKNAKSFQSVLQGILCSSISDEQYFNGITGALCNDNGSMKNSSCVNEVL
ncbi:hypothetical protein JTB14_007319 [Gonioctena quinquepunctata]|nr:hypothetical protein JTB14_007319 [Gonioctena quinquepunctata]